MCASISMILSMLLGSIKGLVMRFSTAITMPSSVRMAIAVEPSDRLDGVLHLEQTTLEENVFTPRSYSLSS